MESTNSNTCARGRHGHGRKVIGALAFALLAGAAGGFAGKALAHGPMGGGFGGPGMFFGGFGHGAIDPAQMDARIERRMKHFAVEVEATPEQTKRLTEIAKQAARDLAPLRQKGSELRKEAAGLFGATVVDRAQLERLRSEQMNIANESSKRMTQALADASEVLTPDQRKKLTDRMQQFGERRGRTHRG